VSIDKKLITRRRISKPTAVGMIITIGRRTKGEHEVSDEGLVEVSKVFEGDGFEAI